VGIASLGTVVVLPIRNPAGHLGSFNSGRRIDLFVIPRFPAAAAAAALATTAVVLAAGLDIRFCRSILTSRVLSLAVGCVLRRGLARLARLGHGGHANVFDAFNRARG